MWSEFVTPELLDLRVWPRLAAIAERLWSPQNVTDAADMYRRLAVVSRDLEWVGAQHVSNYNRLLERLAAGNPVEPVRVLAGVVEQVKDYARGDAHPYTSFSPLNRMVDIVQPFGRDAQQFAALVDKLNAADYPGIREFLTRWRDNDARLQPEIGHSALLAEDAQISKDLAALATAGLQALDRLQGVQPRTAGWAEQQAALLDRAQRPHGELLLSVAPPIRKLIEAAR